MTHMIDRRRVERRHDDRRAGIAWDMQVGEALQLQARHGTGHLQMTLDAKTVGELPPGESFESFQVVLTFTRKSGQQARVRVEAPDHVSAKVTQPVTP